MNVVRHLQKQAIWLGAAIMLAPLSVMSQSPANLQSANNQPVKLKLPPGVEKLCTIPFDKDDKRPSRVEDAALPCLQDVAGRLKGSPDKKLVLVGVSDSIKDHEGAAKGKERMTQDASGLDTRYDDIAAYRAVNAKAYLVKWFQLDPSIIIPTTNENRQGQDVAFYLVPGDADFLHNYLNTTRTNEDPCTVKPCYDPREEELDPQPRTQIVPPGKVSAAKTATKSNSKTR